MQDVWYVVQVMVQWTSLGTSIGLSIGNGPDGAVGFLPVFNTLEEANRAYPGLTVKAIGRVTQENRIQTNQVEGR